MAALGYSDIKVGWKILDEEVELHDEDWDYIQEVILQYERTFNRNQVLGSWEHPSAIPGPGWCLPHRNTLTAGIPVEEDSVFAPRLPVEVEYEN